MHYVPHTSIVEFYWVAVVVEERKKKHNILNKWYYGPQSIKSEILKNDTFNIFTSQKMSYSLYRRLHNVFTNTAKSQVLTAITDAKPKVPPPFNPISEPESSKEQKFRPLIRKFKYLSKDPRFRCRHVNYESFVRRLSRTQQFSAIEDILEHQKIYPEIEDEGFVVRLISLYGKAGMFEQARKLFDEMPELNCDRTIISFNALLAACVNSKKYDKISEIFRELPGKLAIEPDVISYNTVIKALCEMGSLHSAVLAVKEMEKMELTLMLLLTIHF